MQQTEPQSFPPLAWLRRQPRLIRLYMLNSALGFLISGLLTAFILWTNTLNIGTLVSTVDGGWLAVTDFFVLNGLVFDGVQSGVAVMLMTDPDNGDGSHGGLPAPDLAAIPVRISTDW